MENEGTKNPTHGTIAAKLLAEIFAEQDFQERCNRVGEYETFARACATIQETNERRG